MAIYVSEREAYNEIRQCEAMLRRLRQDRISFEQRAKTLEDQGQLASTVNTSLGNLLTDWAALRSEVITTLTGISSTFQFRVKVGQPAAYDGAWIVASDDINSGYGTLRVRAAQENTISPFTLFAAGDRVRISNAEDGDFNGAWTLRYTPQALGSEVLNQGDFSSATNWDSSDLVNITVTGGVANFAGAVSGTLRQIKVDMASAWSAGAYLVNYTVTRSAGSLQVGTDVTANYRTVSDSGTYEAIVYNTGNDDFVFTGVAFTGTIDNVSVKPWTGLAFTGGIGIDTVSNTFDSKVIVTIEER